MENLLTYCDENGIIQNDLIGVNSFLSDFTKIITTTDHKVYGLTGAWGTGKTTFIKIWENKISERQYIHINAFEKDYESNAFLVIFSAIYNYLDKTKKFSSDLEGLVKESRDFLINIAKATGKLAINVIAEKTVGKESWKEFSNEIIDSYFDDIVKKSTEDDNYHKKLVDKLNSISSKLEEPLYIIVDELDRCRPIFALEILEKIKHVFFVNNIKFILVYSEEIFAKIIEKEYGLNNGGVKYLNKFIDRKFYLEYPTNIEKWYVMQIDKEFSNNPGSGAYVDLRNLYSELVKIKEEYFISLRFFIKIISCANNYHSSERLEYLVLLTIEFIRYVNIEELKRMVEYVKANDQFSFDQPTRMTFDHIVTKLMQVMRLDIKTDKADLAHKAFYKICERKKIF